MVGFVGEEAGKGVVGKRKRSLSEPYNLSIHVSPHES